jgi:hypothetical protein
MYFADIHELNSAWQADHEVGEEIADGVTIERRQILKLGMVSMMALLTQGCRTLRFSQPPLAYAALVEELRPMAAALVEAGSPDEERYLRTVAGMLQRLHPVPEVTFRDRSFAMTQMTRSVPLVIYQLRFKPNASIRLHDHRNYNGVLLGLKGEATCRNFDIHGRDDIPKKGEVFTIRQSNRCVLRPGVITSLARRRDNIHDIIAGPQGAIMLDVFTFFTKQAGSHWLKVDKTQPDKDDGLYKVWWS